MNSMLALAVRRVVSFWASRPALRTTEADIDVDVVVVWGEEDPLGSSFRGQRRGNVSSAGLVWNWIGLEDSRDEAGGETIYKKGQGLLKCSPSQSGTHDAQSIIYCVSRYFVVHLEWLSTSIRQGRAR
jgi:hypothetical protein